MAAISISPATFPAGAASALSSTARKPAPAYIDGMGCYGGLKAQNAVSSLGVPGCADKSFAMVVNSIRPSPQQQKKKKKKSGGGGGAMSATCNAAAEIFKIAAIMNALVLVGVAVGFVLLRAESAFEESE